MENLKQKRLIVYLRKQIIFIRLYWFRRRGMILEDKDFFNYCRNTLHKDFFIVPEYNNVKIKEFKETKLKEVKVYFDTDNYNVLQITFDVNNLKKQKIWLIFFLILMVKYVNQQIQ